MACQIQVLFNEFQALVKQKNRVLNKFRYSYTYRLKVNLFPNQNLTKSQLDPFLHKIILLTFFSSFFSLGAQTGVLMQTNSWDVIVPICLSNFLSVTGCNWTPEVFWGLKYQLLLKCQLGSNCFSFTQNIWWLSTLPLTPLKYICTDFKTIALFRSC